MIFKLYRRYLQINSWYIDFFITEMITFFRDSRKKLNIGGIKFSVLGGPTMVGSNTKENFCNQTFLKG